VTVIALCSGKGSPGVSTLACVTGAVWPPERRVVVAECDPSGNDLAARFGLSPRLGMTSLVLAHRRPERSNASFDMHLQHLPGGLETLVGPVNADSAGTLDRELGTTGPGIFPAGIDILVDCGRFQSGASGQQGILRTADWVVVVTRPDAAGLAHTLWTLEVIRSLDTTGTCAVVAVGSNEFPARQIEQTLRTMLLEVVPLDPGSAAMACGAPGKSSRFARSSLVAATRHLVDLLLKEPAADPGSLDDDRSDEPRDDSFSLAVGLELAGSRDQGRDRR